MADLQERHHAAMTELADASLTQMILEERAPHGWFVLLQPKALPA